VPTSEHRQIPRICDVLIRERPRTVLDVGAGYGKFGVLAREYGNAERVDAVDANPPRFAGAYDRVFLGDLRELDRLLPAEPERWDLALFVDVIEHLSKEEGHRVLGTLTRRAVRVLVTTPWGFRPQEIPGMPYETHRSGWYPGDFSKRYRVYRWAVFPGQFSRYLRRPRLWQLMILVGSR
jgi:SAM-dependent methyltransferase